MTNKAQMQITKDLPNKKITVRRQFDATPEQVWKAWTEKEYLDQWWAPKPWRAETKSMDFREGGYWLYAMVGPENEKHWARIDYLKINPYKSYEASDSFCDENGIKNNEIPSMHWRNEFNAKGSGTEVTIEINFKSQADLEKILEMGFEEGFTMALGNLDELL